MTRLATLNMYLPPAKVARWQALAVENFASWLEKRCDAAALHEVPALIQIGENAHTKMVSVPIPVEKKKRYQVAAKRAETSLTGWVERVLELYEARKHDRKYKDFDDPVAEWREVYDRSAGTVESRIKAADIHVYGAEIVRDLPETDLEAAVQRALAGPRSELISLWVTIEKKARWRAAIGKLTFTSWAEQILDSDSACVIQETGPGNAQIQMRVPFMKKERYIEAARLSGLKLAAWIEGKLDAATLPAIENETALESRE